MASKSTNFAHIMTGAHNTPVYFLKFYRARKLLFCSTRGVFESSFGKIIIGVPHIFRSCFHLGQIPLKSDLKKKFRVVPPRPPFQFLRSRPLIKMIIQYNYPHKIIHTTFGKEIVWPSWIE
jgi:hypothetical protein